MHTTQLIQDKWLALAASDRRALSIMVVFLAVVAGYIGVIDPLLTRYEKANAELADLLEKQQSNTRKMSLLPKREAYLDKYRKQWAALQQRFSVATPSVQYATSRTLSELNYYARVSQIAVDTIRPTETRTFSDYTEIPFELEVSGTFSQLHKFMYYIDSSPSLLAITRLGLNRDDASIITASLQVTDVATLQVKENEDAPPVDRSNRLKLVATEGLANSVYRLASVNGYLESDQFIVDNLAVSDSVTIERLLLSDEIDAIALTLPDLLTFWAKGIPLTAILPFGKAPGTEGIVASINSDVQTVAELNQRSIAVDEHGVLPFVLAKALEQNGLSIDSVTQIPSTAAQVARDLANGTIQLGVTREPYLSQLTELNQARVIYSTIDTDQPVIELLATKPGGSAGAQRESLQFLVDAMLKAQTDFSLNPVQTAEAIAEFSIESSAIVEDRTSRLDVFTPQAANTYFTSAEPVTELELYEQYFNTIDKPFPVVSQLQLFDSSFIQTYLLTHSSNDNAANTNGD